MQVLPVLLAAAVVSAAVSRVVHARRQVERAHERAAEAELRAELLRVIANASRDITSLDPDAVLSAVCRATVQAGFDMAEICIADEDLTMLTPVHSTGMPANHVPTPQPITAGIAGLAYAAGEMVIIPSYAAWEGGVPGVRELGILGTCAATPVWTQDGVVVILTVAMSVVGEVSDFQRECLELLARQAGVALQNARRYEERKRLESDLAHRAFHDPLTGLSNRAAFVQRLRDPRLQPSGSHSALLFIDLDDLKNTNDTLGHDAGDQLLAVVAGRLLASIRPEDTVARFGGDEFTVWLESISGPDEAESIARRILASLGEPLMLEGVPVSTSASIGIAIGDALTEGAAMLREADVAMYRAKLQGKGCIHLSTHLTGDNGGADIESR